MCVKVYVCMYIHTYVLDGTSEYYVYSMYSVCVYICTYVCVCMCMYACTYIVYVHVLCICVVCVLSVSVCSTYVSDECVHVW